MSSTKATIDFTGYSDVTLPPVAQNVLDNLFGNVNFPTPPLMQATLQTKLTDYSTALANKSSRATADIIAFNIIRHDLEVMLADLAGYVNIVAKGDLTIVSASGFPYYDTAHPAHTGPPAAPTNVTLRHGDLSGTVDVRCHPDRARSANEAQACTGDPNLEANWHFAAIFTGGKATLGNLTPGSTLWVRLRTSGVKAVMGAWSDPAKIIVI